MFASTIEMAEFESSNLHSALYARRARELYVRFNHGDAIYVYDGVPATEWNGLRNAESVGSYFNGNVRDEYPYLKVTE